jgi:KGK domain
MDEGYTPLYNDEVLFVDRGRVLMSNPTFKVSEFLDALAELVSDREPEWSEDNEGWFSDGLSCEVLRFNGGGWQRGKVRIRLEFLPGMPQQQLPERSSSRLSERPPVEKLRLRTPEKSYQEDPDPDFPDDY